jgi:predicted DsbA family dithiol-disulfide isomerase
VGDEAEERLLRAQLVEGEMLEDLDTLVRLAAEIGLPEDETRGVLDGDAFAAAVRADVRVGAELGITGVPFFVIDRRYGVSGAQPADTFLQVLEQVAREQAAQGTGPA